MFATYLIITCTFVAPPAQTEANEPAPPPTTGSQAELVDGLWPSPKLMNLMLVRWADQLGHQYELEEDQSTKLREAFVKKWESFLTDNRSRLQPVINEFLEMRLELEPPSKERLNAWADKALPAFELVTGQIDKTKSDVREILTPLQRIEFEVNAMEFGLGLKMAESRIRQLQSGEFEPGDFREFWQPTAAERQRRREARAATDAVSNSQSEQKTETESTKVGEEDPADLIAEELKAWEKYVTDFAQLYQFDDGQRNAALSFLTELKSRAINHRDRNRVDIIRLERAIANAEGTDKELEELKTKLTKLYGPIDAMFLELKRRIEPIPSADQRARADSKLNEEAISAKQEKESVKKTAKP